MLKFCKFIPIQSIHITKRCKG